MPRATPTKSMILAALKRAEHSMSAHEICADLAADGCIVTVDTVRHALRAMTDSRVRIAAWGHNYVTSGPRVALYTLYDGTPSVPYPRVPRKVQERANAKRYRKRHAGKVQLARMKKKHGDVSPFGAMVAALTQTDTN